LEQFRAGQTGLLGMNWDNGARTVLVNPNPGGITVGWNLQHTAQDELFCGDRRHRVSHPGSSRSHE